MAKNKISGVSETLTEQMKERFTPISGTENQGNNNSENAEKVRKNFYIEKHLVQLLRKMAYEEETDQTKIVNAALEAYFKEHKYM
jgi:Rod binding domain-containing protein